MAKADVWLKQNMSRAMALAQYFPRKIERINRATRRDLLHVYSRKVYSVDCIKGVPYMPALYVKIDYHQEDEICSIYTSFEKWKLSLHSLKY